MIKWMLNDQEKANKEGWHISHWNANKQAKLGGRIIKLAIVIRVQLRGRRYIFDDDEQAWNHVCFQADKGSEFHQRAVAYIIQHEMENRHAQLERE